MRLTSFTDYSLRTLLYLAANRDRLVTIQDIADLHVISKTPDEGGLSTGTCPDHRLP